MSILFHHRWSIPCLAELEALRGARLVQLLHALGVGRDTLRQTLDGLIDAGLVARNPGHGHPMRPEYVLTVEGAALAPACRSVDAVLRNHALLDVGLRKWSIPIVLALDDKRRFAELRSALGASPRALSLGLRGLADAGVVERRVEPGYPPSTTYRLTPVGRELEAGAARLRPESGPRPATHRRRSR